MKTKTIKIDSIKVDEKLYPRESWNFVTRARYFKAMNSGAEFPNICVAKSGFKYVLIDGLHRLLAHKDRKETHLEVEILSGLTEAEMYEEAVKRNSIHGRQFSTHEVVKIITKLGDFGYDNIKISEIVNIPATELNEFVAKRTTLVTETNENTALKSPLKHLAGGELESEPNQSIFHSSSQLNIVDSLITLIEGNYIDKVNEVLIKKLGKLYNLLEPYKLIGKEEVKVKK